MDYEQILYEVSENILTITLNRPEILNAFTHQMMVEFIDALDQADADDEIRAIIVTGAGRGFCAGPVKSPKICLISSHGLTNGNLNNFF